MNKKSRRSLRASIRRQGKRHRRPAGLAPGTLVLAPEAGEMTIRVMRYGPSELEEHEAVSLDELPSLLGRSAVTWVDVTGVGSVENLHHLGNLFEMHALALEDVAHVDQRPKVEAYGTDLLIFVRMTGEEVRHGEPVLTEQLGLLVRSGLVVTFQERPGDAFEPVRRRIRTASSRLRSNGSDYLTYALLDAVVDRYVLLLESFEDALEHLEELLLTDHSKVQLEQLHRLRRDLISLRRPAAPLRDVLTALLREAATSELFAESTGVFLRDCHDHAVRAVEQIDGGRELANSLMEVYLSTVSHHTNESMKVLTIISTLFIPLGFIAGLYGMNFDTASPWNMPELGWRYGYPTVLGSMVVLFLGLLYSLKRKGWF